MRFFRNSFRGGSIQSVVWVIRRAGVTPLQPDKRATMWVVSSVRPLQDPPVQYFLVYSFGVVLSMLVFRIPQ